MAEIHRWIIYCGYYDFAVCECKEIPDWDCPKMIEEENEEFFNGDFDDEEDFYHNEIR